MSSPVEELIGHAVTLARASDFGAASEQVNRHILEIRPNDTASMTRLAKCLVVRGAAVEAQALYERVLEINPENGIAQNALAALRGAPSGADRIPSGGRRAGAGGQPRGGRRLGWRARTFEIAIPAADATRFGAEMRERWYGEEERDYKVAVHLVMAALLSPEHRNSGRFPALIADVFGTEKPDLVALGLGERERRQVSEGVRHTRGLHGAFSNLCGGRFGYWQFRWLPGAVQKGLGGAIAEAFRQLVEEGTPLVERVDNCRSTLTVAAEAYRGRGGEILGDNFRTSLAFVALLLGGYDPTAYTFYMTGSLEDGYQRYARGTTWPKGCSRGEVYEDVCAFVRAIGDGLRAHGVPVRDLIDAESFIWVRYRPHQTNVSA